MVDAAGVGKANDAHCLKESQHTDSISFGSELWYVEAHLHVALGSEVIDLVRSDLCDDADERAAVGHVAPVQVHQTFLLHVAHPLVEI